jgi:CRP-like cAMP-binding protein
MRESSGRSSRGNAPESPGELRHIRVLRELSDEHLARIFPLLRRQSMRARSTIVFEGEFENAVTFIWSGRVRMTAVAPTGISISLSSMGPGSLFGHGLAVMRYKPQANIRLVADETATLLLLPASEFSALLSVSLPLVTALMHEFAQSGATLASRTSARVCWRSSRGLLTRDCTSIGQRLSPIHQRTQRLAPKLAPRGRW